LEDDAVLVGGKDLFEPDPLDSANITGYDCAQGQPPYLVNLPPYSPPPHVERDVNQDGVQGLFGPLVARTQLIKIFDLAGPFPTPSEQNFDFAIPTVSFAQHARFMLLQDRPSYGAALLNRQLQDISSGASWANFAAAFAVEAL